MQRFAPRRNVLRAKRPGTQRRGPRLRIAGLSPAVLFAGIWLGVDLRLRVPPEGPLQ